MNDKLPVTELKEKSLTIKITPGEYQRIDEVCRQRKIKKTDLVRWAIRRTKLIENF
jgi:hypothetical protein